LAQQLDDSVNTKTTNGTRNGQLSGYW